MRPRRTSGPALQDHGFSVLTEIDVASTFKEKLGLERAPLKILGACNPGFAYRAILIDPWAVWLCRAMSSCGRSMVRPVWQSPTPVI